MILEIPIEQIMPDPNQPRKTFDQAKIDSLGQSIKQVGLIQPILVRPADANGVHLIVAGERRYRAHLSACIGVIRCCIYYGENKAETLAVQLIENLDREDMNPVDTAKGFQSLLEAGWQIETVAERTGLSPSTIQSKLNLLNLDQRIQKQVAAGQLFESVAIALSRLSKNGQFLALRRIKSKSYAEARPVIDAVLCQEQQVDLFAAPESKRDANKLVRAYTMAMLSLVAFCKKVYGDDYRVLAGRLDDGRLGKRIDEIDLAIKGLKRIKHELEVYQHAKKLRRVA